MAKYYIGSSISKHKVKGASDCESILKAVLVFWASRGSLI